MVVKVPVIHIAGGVLIRFGVLIICCLLIIKNSYFNLCIAFSISTNKLIIQHNKIIKCVKIIIINNILKNKLNFKLAKLITLK